MAQSFPDLVLTGAWQDICVTTGYTAIAGSVATVQAKGNGLVSIYFGGASAPGADDGVQLSRGQGVTGTSTHIWVKGEGRVAVLQED